MKAIVLAIIGAIAAAMAYFAFQDECPGGNVFASLPECRAASGSDPAFCRDVFADAQRKATEDYAPFANQTDCLATFPVCQPHTRVTGGFVPVPRGVCAIRSAKGAEGRPVYERQGANMSANTAPQK